MTCILNFTLENSWNNSFLLSDEQEKTQKCIVLYKNFSRNMKEIAVSKKEGTYTRQRQRLDMSSITMGGLKILSMNISCFLCFAVATVELTWDYQLIFSYHQVTMTVFHVYAKKNKITSLVIAMNLSWNVCFQNILQNSEFWFGEYFVDFFNKR